MILRIPRKLIFFVVLVLLITVFTNPMEMIKGALSDEDEIAQEIIDTSGSSIDSEGMRDTILFYKDENGLLTPVMRKIAWTEGRGIAKQALNAMINTPENYEDMIKIGLYPVIPSSTQILGMTIRDGICKVDFSKDFTSIKNKEEEQNLIQSVVYTLTEFPTVDEVQFMIEGEIMNNMPYGIQIGMPLKRDSVNFTGKKPALDTVLVYNESGSESNPTSVPVTTQVEAPKDNKVLNLLDTVMDDVKGHTSE